MILPVERLIELVYELKPVVRKNTIVCNCPNCGEREFGISINKENHVFGCYRKSKCGVVGNIYSLIKILGKNDFLAYGTEQSVKLEEPLFDFFSQYNDNNYIELPTINLPDGFVQIDNHPYLNKRNFLNWQYKQFTPGFATCVPKYKRTYIIFPIYFKGYLKGWVGRCCLDNNQIAYRESIGLSTKRYDNGGTTEFGSLLYGFDELSDDTQTVILAEGIFSKFAIDRAYKLYQRQDIKCLATFGAKITEQQKALLKTTAVENIMLMHESDVLLSTQKTLSSIQNYYNVTVAVLSEKDPDEMTQEELREVTFHSPDYYHSLFQDFQ